MRLPVDTSRLTFLVVAPAEPLRQYEEGKPRDAWAPRTDANGEVLWRVQLVALGDGEAEIVRVVVPGDPKVARGEMVSVDDPTAQAWELEGRSAMAFRCGAVHSAAGGRRPGRARRRPSAWSPPSRASKARGEGDDRRTGKSFLIRAFR
jgi:hypothetical protein